MESVVFRLDSDVFRELELFESGGEGFGAAGAQVHAGLANLREDEADRRLRGHFILVDHDRTFGDALAALWTAERIRTGVARSLPAASGRAANGVPIAIWY